MNPTPTTPQDPKTQNVPDDGMQGEGNYEAARRHRRAAEDFIAREDVEGAARDAAPDSAEEAAEMQQAELEGRSHAKK